MRVIVADDDAVSRRLVEATLVRAGHEVTVVADGLAAIEVTSRPDSPQLAIIDWMMPGADGLAVCRAIRERVGPYIYVILLTARQQQQDMIDGLAAEADDFLRKPFDPGELLARIRSGQRILDLQARLLAAQTELRHQATHDALTGLPNRAMAIDHLSRELDRSRRASRPCSVAIADIDHFKRINDTFGHAAGDQVLRACAVRMMAVRRPYDLVARYGGEEFLMLFPDCNLAAAAGIAERLRLAVSDGAIPWEGTPVDLTISIGVASTPDGIGEATRLVTAADEALYRAKSTGRNRVEC